MFNTLCLHVCKCKVQYSGGIHLAPSKKAVLKLFDMLKLVLKHAVLYSCGACSGTAAKGIKQRS